VKEKKLERTSEDIYKLLVLAKILCRTVCFALICETARLDGKALTEVQVLWKSRISSSSL
jgi:hypothetical protein